MISTIHSVDVSHPAQPSAVLCSAVHPRRTQLALGERRERLSVCHTRVPMLSTIGVGQQGGQGWRGKMTSDARTAGLSDGPEEEGHT
jgi:hypothetical protein